MSTADPAALSRHLAAVAAFGLAGAPPIELTEPLSNDAWVRLLASVTRERLVGVLASAIDAQAVPVTGEQLARMADLHEEVMLACIALEQYLHRIADVLEPAAIDFAVVKGPAAAHGWALDASERQFGDIDILVRSADIDRTVAALEAAEATRFTPELRPGFDRRFAKSVTMAWGPFEIDVHRTLAPGRFGLDIDEASLWAGVGASGDETHAPATFTVAGRPFATLTRPMHFVHACYHAALGDRRPSLASLRDIQLLAAEVTIDEALAIAEPWGGAAVLAHALAEAAERVPSEVGDAHRWARGYAASERDLDDIASYHDVDDRFASTARHSLASLPLGQRPAFALALALPSAENLEARGLTRGAHLRQLLRRT